MQQIIYTFTLFLVLSLGGATYLVAQCSPVDSLPSGTIISPRPYTVDMPQNGIQDTACVNTPYQTDFQLNLPRMVAFPPFGDITIDSAVIIANGVTGLPMGFSYACNYSRCVFYPNEIGCIRISGTTAMEGLFNLAVTVRVFSGLLQINQTLPSATLAPGEYRLYVRPFGSQACVSGTIEEGRNRGLALGLAPNPATGLTLAKLQLDRASQGELRVLNALGQVVFRQSVDAPAGSSQWHISTAGFGPGLYTVVYTDGGRRGVSSRLVVVH